MNERPDKEPGTRAETPVESFRAEVAAALSPEENLAGGDNPGTEHPGLDELIAYHAGELGDVEAGRLQDHLVACGGCLDRLSELEGFVAAEEQGPPEVGDLEEATAWRALRPRLSDPQPGRVTERRASRASRNLPWTLAASFLVAALGTGLWAFLATSEVATLRTRLARLAQPRPSVAIDLFADSMERSPDGRPAPVDLDAPTGADHLTLFLHLPEAPDHPAYEANITDADGRELWRGAVFEDEAGIFTLGIPRAFLTAGRYRITLYGVLGGVTGDTRRPLATYPLDLASGDERH